MLKRFFICILLIILLIDSRLCEDININNNITTNAITMERSYNNEILNELLRIRTIPIVEQKEENFNNEPDSEPTDVIENVDDNYVPTITVDRSDDDSVIYYRYNITESEFNEFVRVVEAEVTGDYPFGTTYDEAFKCKLSVAQVILNRVESPYFPDTVHDVIFQKNAFTPLLDGRYYKVDISQVTIDACKAALLSSTEDTTYGCEFFSSGTKTCKYGSYVFTDEVGHSFFKSYR